MRVLRGFLIFFLCFVLVAPQVADAARRAAPRYGVNDPRYAVVIMNPKTGEIYHSRNADARRYPASLTKMMTLYLLFEALEQKKFTLNSQLKVSAYAATMPRTNLALRAGQSIPVETAIKALVVQSANDVAVVVAENVGGSVSNFAARATQRSRDLGMNGTVFKNPHGLPNDAQYTTARDMAKLGIALKRDFPQYYHYFSTRQFSWKGATYYTHNRVMTRYSGTDGIKTGFINKSGFNVVSSVVRGGRPLIGVVMGGGSGRWRDDRMIQLLDQGYKVIADRGQKRGRIYATNLPTPIPGSKAAEVARAQAVAEAAKPAAAAPVVIAAKPPTAVAMDKPELRVDTKEVKPGMSLQITGVDKPAVKPVASPKPHTFGAQLAARSEGMNTSAAASELGWGIQVGAFSSQELAEQAVKQAFQLASTNLEGSRMAVVGAGQSGSQVHRARLENLSENQAKKACEVLISNNSPCFIFRADSKNL